MLDVNLADSDLYQVPYWFCCQPLKEKDIEKVDLKLKKKQFKQAMKDITYYLKDTK